MIPAKVLEQHIAILGKTGSGKSYTAKGIAEGLLRAKQRVCVLDPTDAWWGLRSDSTGKKPAFPIVVFGGEHGDCPLGQQHGSAIAEIIGTTNTPAVLSTRLMTVGERTRFFTDFAETLLRKNRGPLHLILDEAHVFAPQGRVADPQSGKMLHAANNLVSLGRGVGLRIILISQRPAKLHKDSLTQAETLIAMRLIAPQDRSAVEDWIGEWADPKQGKEILASLPSLPTGDGWLWSPEIGILKRMHFPEITTYDNSRAPDGSTAKVVLADIDLPTIQARLETVAHDAFENDPKRLRARIVELEREKKAAPMELVSEPKIIEKPVLKEGELARLEAAIADLQAFREKFTAAMEPHMKRLAEAMAPAVEALRAVKFPVPASPVRQVAPRPASPAGPPRTPKAAAQSNGNLTGPEQRILDAIAWMEGIGIQQPDQVAVAFLAGYTYGGGGFNNPRGALNTKGYVEYAAGNTIRLTEEGRSHARFPQEAGNAEELQRMVLDRLPGPERKILEVILSAYPNSISNEECAEKAGYTHGGGGYNNPRGRLRTLGLIDYPCAGQVLARPILFLEGRA